MTKNDCMITLFATSAGSSNACVTEPFVWFCSRNGSGTSGKPCEPRHLAWIWVWLLQQPWNHTNIKSWKHWNSWNSLYWSFGQKHRTWRIALCVSHCRFLWISSVGSLNVWGIERLDMKLPWSSNWVSLTSQTSVAFTWHLQLRATNLDDCIGIPWSIISTPNQNNSLWKHTAYTSPCWYPIPNAFFLPCSVLLSEAQLWKKASILASLIQGVGQRSLARISLR